MSVGRLKRSEITRWLRLRSALWPSRSLDVQRREMADILSDEEFNAVFVGRDRAGHLTGFLEASLRLRAEGCHTSPIGYVEGWYVVPGERRKGVGGALLARAEAWAAARGCREMASDADMEDGAGRAAHRDLGYEETSRLAHFRKALPDGGARPR